MIRATLRLLYCSGDIVVPLWSSKGQLSRNCRRCRLA